MSSKMTSSQLDGMIYGMLLGDGCVRKPTKAGTCNFILHHSTKQKKYLLHKLDLLENISHVTTNYWVKDNYNKKYDKYYKSVYAQTNFLNYFKKLRKIFYAKDGTKIVTKKILNKLTPLGLALWWQDDGCLYVKRQKYNNVIERRAYLATHSFSKEENQLIKEYFAEKWNIKVSIKYQHGCNKFFISFPVKEFLKFKEVIKDYIIPSMYYKIDTKPELNRKPGPKKRVGNK